MIQEDFTRKGRGYLPISNLFYLDLNRKKTDGKSAKGGSESKPRNFFHSLAQDHQ